MGAIIEWGKIRTQNQVVICALQISTLQLTNTPPQRTELISNRLNGFKRFLYDFYIITIRVFNKNIF